MRDPALDEFIHQIREEVGDRLKEVRLFGSRARGNHSRESDYDLLVIVDKVTPQLEESIEALGTRWLLDEGVVISTFVFSEADLERLRFEPFIMNIEREGVRIA